MSAFALLVLAVCVMAPTHAEAAFVSGQQEAWTINYGTAKGKLHNPLQLAADPLNGSVVIGDLSGNNETFRVQKFSSTGTSLGVTAPIPVGPAQGVIGIALNPTASLTGRFYVIQTTERATNPLSGQYVAEKLLEYSLEPAAGTGELGKVAEFNLPAVESGNALVAPREIAVDPSSGELVVLAQNESQQVILQRIDAETGALVSRYTETGTTILGTALPTTSLYGMAVDQSGLTYIVTSGGKKNGNAIRAYTLASNFGSATLTAVPGFAAAVTSEEWPSSTSYKLIAEPVLGRYGDGAQVAVTSAGGSDTIYFKTQFSFVTASEPGIFYIHGYSVAEKATSVIYGGGSNNAECAVQGKPAALAADKDGTLEVLDQGQFVETESAFPAYGPNVLRFGPDAGTACPVPAASLELKENGARVTKVAPGATVTLDGSKSELNGQTLAETTWTIEGPGGTTETKSVAAPATSVPYEFTTLGNYTVREKIKTSALEGVGTTFSAQPQPLEVTNVTTPAPTVTSVDPTEGSTAGGETITVEGTNLGSPTGVSFGGTAGTQVTEVSATKLTVKSPAHAAGPVDVTVTTAGGTSATGAADEFTFKAPVVPAPTVTGIAPGQGSTAGGTLVTITGTELTGATEVKFGTTAVSCTGVVTTCKVESATEIKATTPALAAGPVDVHVVTGGGESATNSPADRFTAETPVVISHTLTIDKAGTGSGSVTCNGGTCAASYTQGTEVTLAAAPASGSTFAGWSGGNCSGVGTCKVTIQGDTTVTATFNLVSSGGGGGTGGGSSGGGTGGSGGGSTGGGGGVTNPGGGSGQKTAAQKLKEERQKAIAKCKKLHGKAEAKCMQKAHQIGKPKKKTKKKAARELVVGVFGWDGW